MTTETQNDTQYLCTVCGRIGSVGRCCGLETRIQVNDAAIEESYNKYKSDFETWWDETGSAIIPNPNHDMEQHAKRVAFVAYCSARIDPMIKLMERLTND